jgi:VWFA-related protein
MVFLVDASSLDPKARSRFARSWSEILDATEEFDVPRAAYMIDPTGDLTELAPMTYAVEDLRGVPDQIRAVPVFGTSMESKLLQLQSDIEAAATTHSTAHMIAMGYENDELRRSLDTLGLLTQFCNSLAARSGRTALVWVSVGLKLTEGGPFSALAGYDPFLHSSPHAGIIDAQTALHQAANSANVSIYAVDPTLASDRRNIGLGANASASGLALQSDEVQWAISGLSDSLYNAAAATGGQAFVMWSDLGRALRTVESDGQQYYMLTYAAPDPQGDHEYHEIRVEVERPEAVVRARQGYVDLPDEERESLTVAAALALPGTVTGMAVEAEAVNRWSKTGEPIAQMITSISSNSPLLEVHAAAVTGEGRIVAEAHEDVINLVSTGGESAAGGPKPFVHVHDWALEPGEYELRVAVRDGATGRLGAACAEVEVPEITTGWRSSDLLLTVAAADGEQRPVVGGKVRDGDTVSLYIEVAGGIAPFISGVIVDTEVADSKPALLPAYRLPADTTGLHRGAIALRNLPPGNFLLKISVTDAHADRQAYYERPLEVSPRPAAVGTVAASEAGAAGLAGLEEIDLNDPASLQPLLERLARVAFLYMDQALSFVADEVIESTTYHMRRSPPRRTRSYEYEYIYGRMDEKDAARLADLIPGEFADYRRRKGSRRGEMAPDEIVEEMRLPALISKAYSFPLIFRESLWPLHEFEILGEEVALGRRAIAVSIRPQPPFRRGLNDWFGTAWFDRESLQPLKFEVFLEDDYIAYSGLESAMRGEGATGDFTFTRVTALFDTIKNGMRFPSEIVQERARHRVHGEPEDRESSRRMEFRVSQRYSNYRFFNVRTEEEVHDFVFRRIPGEGGQ